MTDAVQTPSNGDFTKRVFSGVQPTGALTLGNYLGALKRFVDMQNEDYETIYCIVDLHAITVWQDPEQLKNNTRQLAAFYIASGLNPEKSILFNQSAVSEHAELGWIFNCVARMGWMKRMTQFKDKAGKNAENASLGLFGYPALMAADILLYDATHVPVGEDQKQHLELSRDIANKFNLDFNSPDFLVPPEPLIQKKFARIMSLKDGMKKMSKSDPSELSRINLNDSSDQILNKIKKAKTDAEPLPDDESKLANRPEAENLLGIYSSLCDQTLSKTINEFAGKNFSDFKEKLANLVVDKISPISSEINKLLKDENFIDKVLSDGAGKASQIASEKIKNIKKIIGF
mgnify:CR=1 FL=1